MVVVGTVVVVGAGTEAVEKLGIAARCCRTQVTVAVVFDDIRSFRAQVATLLSSG